jgi:GH25 family lysozyme M1 (1,4-beta-N-acetylmuramidase)
MGSRAASLAAVCVVAVAACAADDGDAVSTDPQFAVACADGPTIQGIDVSYYEDSVDWAAVHAAGIEFAFIRVTDGTTYLDPKFAAYWAGARAAGVIRGAYQFFRPAEDPIAQADLLLDRMGPLEPGDLPPVIDVEVSGGLAKPDVAAAVRAWVEHVTARLGRPPIVYAGLYSWPELTGAANVTTSPLWVAQYTSALCPDIPSPWTRWRFWQHTSTGHVDGIPGEALDRDRFNGTLDDLRAFAAPGSCGDGVCSGGELPETCAADCPPCGTIASAGGVIDDGDACFVGGGPAAYLRSVTGAGDQGDLIWTHATAADTEANFAQWNLYFETAGRYQVEAYTAHAYAGSKRATYVVEASAAPVAVAIDQTAADGWQSLGAYDFLAGGAQSIHLGDNTGEPSGDNIQLVFDAIRLTRIADADPGAPSIPPSGGSPPPGGSSDPSSGGAQDPPPPAPPGVIAGCAATTSPGVMTGPLVLALLVLRRSRPATRRRYRRRPACAAPAGARRRPRPAPLRG